MYELIKWEGQREQIPAAFNIIYLDPNDETAPLFGKTTDANENEIIDILDFTISKNVKKAEKQDYAFAVISGLLSYVVNYFVVGKNNVIDLNKNVTRQDLEKALKQLIRLYYANELTDAQIEKQLRFAAEKVQEGVQNVPEYKNLVMDFANGISIKALVISILEQILNVRVGRDENGKFTVNKLSEDEQTVGIYAGIAAGFMKWLVNAADEYRKTGKFKNEANDLMRLKDVSKHVKAMIDELSQTALFKNKVFDKTELNKWLVKKINAHGKFSDEKMPLGKLFIRQEIPVQFNRCLVLTYLFAKKFITEIKVKNVKQIVGLKFIEFTDLSDEQAVLDRMHTVSTGVFTVLNSTHALAEAALAGAKNVDKGMPIALASGAMEFAAWINFANCVELVTVIKADKEYLAKDIQREFEEHQKSSKVHVEQKTDFIVQKYTMLNDIETKILYSLELKLIEEDIRQTNKNDIQILKDKWKNEWKVKSIESLNLQKLFMEDNDKLFAMLVTHASTEGDNGWLYRIILELKLFKPYYQLEIEKPNKEYEKLKLVNDKYVENIICRIEGLKPYISKKDVKKLMADYQENYNSLDKKLINTPTGAAGTIAATAIAAGVAYAFAPAIAVSLVGGSLVGLHGAALTSASLALLGGGSLAAGGLGMAGGAMVIAGGGALLGLGSSGITVAAIALMASPEYVQTDFAKLLTNCSYILLGKYNQIENVQIIQDSVEEELNNMRFQTVLIEERADLSKKDKKELIKNLKESIRIYTAANEQLKKMIKEYLKHHKN